jgi:hypothetical protein
VEVVKHWVEVEEQIVVEVDVTLVIHAVIHEVVDVVKHWVEVEEHTHVLVDV